MGAPAAPVVGVLGLQGAFALHAQVLGGLGVATADVRTPADLAGVDALVLPGGESTAISLLLASSGLADPLRDRLAGGMPVLGTCAGMILLAAEVLDGRPDQLALGAVDISVRRNGFGRQVASFEADLQVEGLGPPFPGVFIRAPVVERVGERVEVLASVDGRPALCRQGSALVSSFHPELRDDPRVHELFMSSVVGESRL